MNKELSIQSWPASYYLNSERRWLPGRLSLTPTHLRFREDQAETFSVNFHLSGISEMRKESSSYVFSSITVLEKDNVKHWFSSLQPNRSAVFTVLEHFWREQLVSPRPRGQEEAKSSKGQELLSLANGCQKRLEDTGRVLHHQGQQFDNMVKDLSKIEADMSAADRMLSALEAPLWWPFSGNPWKRLAGAVTKETPGCDHHQGKEGVVAIIPVVFSHNAEQSLKPGKLTVLLSALEIADCHLRLLHRYERRDVDEIRAHTGHEITVRQRFIGKPDIAYRILSARLPDILPLLEMQYGKKMEFMEEAAMFSDKWRSSPSSPGWQTESWLLDTIVRSGAPPAGEAAIQDHQVSQSEAQELRKILMKLKGMALEAEGELERQDETLEEITSSVDNSVFSIDKQTRRMRKLL